jgi:CubicO group peptidase (beta-lactamase class C family)
MAKSGLVPDPRVTVFPPAEITSIDAEHEVDPREVGLYPEDIEAIWGAVVRHYQTGLHPALALCIRYQGRVILRRALGHLRGNEPPGAGAGPLEPLRHDALFNVYSSTKAITAMVIHLLDQRRLLHLDDPVADYIPAFARHGKEDITIRQLLTHRAGIPALPGDRFELSMLQRPGEVIELLCDARPLSVPGRRLAYHALTGGFLLGEIVERVTGRPLRRFLDEEIAAPWKLGTFNYGVPPERAGEVARNALTGPQLPPIAWMFQRSIGVDPATAVAYANDPIFLTSVVPAGNLITTSDGGCRFFEGLRLGGTLEGVQIFEPRTVRRALAEQSFLEMDSSLGLPVRYSMGFMLGGDVFSVYGPRTTRAFGHVGFSNVLLWADPDRELSAAYLNTGKPFATLDQLAWLAVPRAIAQRLDARRGR